VTHDVTIALTTKDRPGLTLLAVRSALTSAPGARILVVDSGSSPENLRRLEDGLESVELQAGTYTNAAAARNAALQLVDSEFVGFLDSDDLMRPAKITCLRPLLVGDPEAVLAVGRTVVIDANGEPGPDLTKLHHELYDVSERLGTSYSGQCVRFTAFTSATLMRRAALEEIGGYDERLPAMEDVDLYLRLALIGNIQTQRCVVADYRVWADNVNAATSAEGIVAVAEKHLANLPDLPRSERRTAEYALNMRAALSQQTLLHTSLARHSLARAVGASPAQAFGSTTFWRVLASSLVPRRVVALRRASSGYAGIR
jgi:glycosyltransferase involved in cell wall biosynthesis